MKYKIYIAFKKLGLLKIYYYIINIFTKSSFSCINDSLKKLNKIHKDINSTCIIKSNFINNKEKYDLDVIVPCYNVEKYVERCIDSILNQKTNYNYRIIIINDGSTDNTKNILQKYKNIKNILLLDQKNGGSAAARNEGLKYCNAKYVMFVDSDDTIPNDSINLLMKKAYELDAPIVCGGFNCINKNDKTTKKIMVNSGILPYLEIHGFPWGKVIKSNLFDKIVFPQGYLFEDSIINHIITPQANNKIYGISNLIYNYRKNTNSVTYKFRINLRCIDSLYIALRLIEDRKILKIKTTQDYYEFILNIIVLTYERNLFIKKNQREYIFNVWCDMLQDEFKNYETNNSKLKKMQNYLRTRNFIKYDILLRYYL